MKIGIRFVKKFLKEKDSNIDPHFYSYGSFKQNIEHPLIILLIWVKKSRTPFVTIVRYSLTEVVYFKESELYQGFSYFDLLKQSKYPG